MALTELIGPFSQLISLADLPLKGALKNVQLDVLPRAGLLVSEGLILEAGDFDDLWRRYKYDDQWRRNQEVIVHEVMGDHVLLPGFTDAHTHLIFAGSRAGDYALRSAGLSYSQVAAAGGGIWNTVQATRAATDEELLKSLFRRLNCQLEGGITTTEVKTGYGLSAGQELRMLRLIKEAATASPLDLVPTCLAAHMIPVDFNEGAEAWLDHLGRELLPQISQQHLSERIDIFIEEGAFSVHQARKYLHRAAQMGFDVVVHADQFSCGGSALAVELHARSADHLEASRAGEIRNLGASATAAIVLPGASLGLGLPFAPARALLDAGASLVIASDWNPGSAPMGNLLMQASVMGAAQKLCAAEIYAALCFRAAAALGLYDRGRICPGQLADLQAFPVADHHEILYNQGMLRSDLHWKRGMLIKAGRI